MATYSFSDDTIVGDFTSGTATEITTSNAAVITLTAAAGSGNYTFNPFAHVTAVDSNTGDTDGDMVRFKISFANRTLSGGTDGETLFAKVSGAQGDNAGSLQSFGFGSVITFQGTGAAATTWLQSLYLVDTSLNDSFTLTLRYVDASGTNLGSNKSINYRIFTACYLQGTLIGTPAGQRAVESLRAGDLVTTLDGSAKPVKWIGHRTYEAEFGASEAFVRPVVFKAGSLGAGLPVRDLKVSPEHGIWIDGAMVPAAALVNDVSIVRDMAPGHISYYHIELDGHEAVFAEGAAAETFVDHDSRAMFDNADEYNLLYGTSGARPAEQPRVSEGSQVAAIRRRLAAIAGIAAPAAAAGPMQGNLESIENGVLHGWVVDAAGADAVEAEVLVDGEVVGRIVANRYRTDLDKAGIAGGRGGFSIALPASAERLEQVSLRRIVDGRTLAAPAEMAQA